MKALWVERDGIQVVAGAIFLKHKLNIQVVRAKTFDVGFEMFINGGFDLILMEPCFPGPQGKRYNELKRDEVGITFVEDIRKISPVIPIILASSLVWMGSCRPDTESEELWKRYKKNNCKFLEMPYSLEELEKIVKESVRR